MGVVRTVLAGAAIATLMAGVSAAAISPEPVGDAAREAKFDAAISATDQIAWLKDMASAPNQVGSLHDRANAETTLALFRSWGWDAHIETFDVLYPTPISTTLERITPTRTTLGGQEPAVPGDESSAHLQGALPPYVAYQGDGDVIAPLVYVNYGMPADYEALGRRGIDVKGKIVIARYGGGWRGLKPKLAEDHGAIGCLIYSDPADDGYAKFDPYPKGGGRSAHAVQRGSVQDMVLYPGDPLTPGIGATKDAKRLTRAQAVTLLHIPTLPISYADATQLLIGLEGPIVPANARGALPIAYHYGGTNAVTVHLAVTSDWSLKTIYDVIAMMKGRTAPDEWVIRANHRDAWVFGAADPLSGHVAMLSEAKALGQLAKAGWRPERTIVYASWDGEEPGLLGSTEWAETHADELQKKAVLYINTDNNGRGALRLEGSHDLQHFANLTAANVIDPETGKTLLDRQRATILAHEFDVPDSEKKSDVAAARAGGDLPIGPLGSGSDYSAFLQHLGIAAIDISFRGEDATTGSYHSVYDSLHHYLTFDDPGLKYGVALSRYAGRLVLRAADAQIPLSRYGDFASTVASYVGEVKTLASEQRARDILRERLQANDDFRLAATLHGPIASPPAKDETPAIDMTALDNASARLTKSATAIDSALATAATLPAETRTQLTTALRDIDQLLLDPAGLPGRPWYRNLIYAPGRFTGYGAKTLPGVREAIEDRHFTDAATYVARTTAVLNAYSDRLDAAATIARSRQ